MLLLYGLLAGSNEDLFWALFAFSGVLFLLPYVGMMLAFLHMRRVDGERHRPYRVPGGPILATVLSWVCILFLSIAILLFMVTPADGPQWEVIAGMVALLALGEWVIRYAEGRSGSRF